MNDEKLNPGHSSISSSHGTFYAWAKLRYAGYRDFTASRREARARFRSRALQSRVAPDDFASEAPDIAKAVLPEVSIPEVSIPESSISDVSIEDRCGMQDENGRAVENVPFVVKTERPLPPAAAEPPLRSENRAMDLKSQAEAHSWEQELTSPVRSPSDSPPDSGLTPHTEFGAVPQWLEAAPERAAVENLADARERIASRWFALQGVLASDEDATAAQSFDHPRALTVPAAAIFSMAGGVGKTSLAAGLGRALAACEERVLLVDMASSGLLPFYFGSRDLRPGTVRTFLPPEGSGHAPVHLLTLDAASRIAGGEPDPLLEAIRGPASEAQRILIDIPTADLAAILRWIPLAPVILVPLLADMNSVVSLGSMESAFSSRTDGNGRTLQVFYLLNQFDPGSPLHLDVREILQRQLGDRLLPFVIHRDPVVSEALAEGMTVMDYAPNATVTENYLRVADWLRSISSTAAATSRGLRWSER